MSAYDELPHRFGQVLREARQRAGLSQDELSYRAGISRNHVGEIERGVRSPTLVVVVRLADALGLRLTTFLAPLDAP